MHKNNDELNNILDELLLNPENECVEFKKAENNFDIDKVMMLDRVQKGLEISKEQSDYLRKDDLIEGRYPNVYISSDIAKITNKKNEYIDNKGLDNSYYKDYIITYIEKFGHATREDINNLIYPKLPSNMTEKNKNNRVRYIIALLKKEEKIINEGSLTKSSWIIKK